MIALAGVTIQSKIYESSASLVYRGIREEDGRAIVVKVLKQDYPSPQELTRYRQEYAITRSLSLDGVVKAYCQQEYQRTLVILLEDFGGESLEYWMQQRPDVFHPMSLPAFLKLAIDLTDILGKIHAAQIIHKDINPSNIILNLETGDVKIIDFGIATQFNRTNPTFKSPHVLEGTLAYLSPEQTGRMNRLLDCRTDFYSLGVSFYELLTGQLPFPTTDILELVHCHIAKQPVLPHELNTAIPQAVSDIILKLMAKNAEDRYQSAWGIKADLEACAQQLEATGRVEQIQLGLQDVSDKFYIPQKLYGREAEVVALLAAFVRVACPEDKRVAERNSREGRNTKKDSISAEMMLVSGYSGIGKSALVQELYKPITAKRGYFVSGKFDQLQRNIPYSAIVTALQKLVQQLLSEPDEQLQQWRSRLLTALGSNGQIIIDVIPEVELIIGQQQPVPEVGATEAQNRFNRVFKSFVRVFCSKEHPLVIFLDDLQWIDSATLKLIELMLLDEQTQFLFLIGAYRDNEVTSTHPLALTLEKLRQQGAGLQEINLSPLTLEPVCQLIAETLHQDTGAVRDLAQLVLDKTEGNPFFINEFLRTLYAEDCLTFNLVHAVSRSANRRNWHWNIEQIRAKKITDNVVVLMTDRLNKLPESIKETLQLAACVGNEFNLKTLSMISGMQAHELFSDLVVAVQSGLIVPLSELNEQLLIQNYKFLHDRVQQAAYALIDVSQKQVVHLQIGRNLLKKTLPERLSERLFEIVDHLNYGIELVADQAERDEIARLNLMAGQKAKASTAYTATLNYFTTGIELLASNSWQCQYDLTLILYQEATEAAYLNGDFEQMEKWATIVSQQAKTSVDQIRVNEIRIQTYTAQGQQIEAVNVGLQTLKLLGINLPELPTEVEVQQRLEEIAAQLQRENLEEIADRVVMTHPEKLAAMRILSSMHASVYQAAPALLPLIVCEQIDLSLTYGNAALSTFAYATYGKILNSRFQDFEGACEFGTLALNLVDRLNTNSFRSRTFVIVGAFAIYGKYHIRETIPLLEEGYLSGVNSGDLEWASLAALDLCQYLYFSGQELMELEKTIASYDDVLVRFRQQTLLRYHRVCWQSVLNLLGQNNNPCCLQGTVYDEETTLSIYQATKDIAGLFYFYVMKLILAYLFGEITQACEAVVQAKLYFGGALGLFSTPLFYFYNSLIQLQTYLSHSSERQKQLLLGVIENQEYFWKWVHHAPMNFQHKYDLVEAEKARVLGQFLEAEELYEQAIQGARENEFIQEEALAYELAAKHYLARGRTKIAQTYMKEAHYCYERWGAIAKVKDLETRYPQFFSQSSNTPLTLIRTTSRNTYSSLDSSLDLASVLKASQAISREIELDQLLRSLMQILIENAGAQTGYLLLESAGEWTIEAACELHEGEQVCATQVLQSISMANRLPESIIQYVVRTHESVILNDAAHEDNFIHDPYIQDHQTQSVLCLPLLNQSKLVGVLYLENRLVTGAFTAERSQLLDLLSTQAAIAIENARLYSALRASKSQMTQFLEAVPVGIAVFDAVGRPYYFNQRATQLAGKGSDPSVPLDQLSEAYQVYLAGTKQPYPIERLPSMRALSGERSTVNDIDFHQNGTIIPVEVWSTPVFDEQGNVIYAIAAFQDITERKQAEQLLANYNHTLEQQVAERTRLLSQEIEERQRVENALRQSEEQRRLTMDFTYIGSWSWNIVESTTDWNDNHVRLLGLVPGEVESSYQVWRERVHPEDIERVEQAVTAALANHTDFEAEYRVIYPDGSIHWLVGRGRGIYNAVGQPVQMLGVILDISDRKRAEAASILEERNRMAREIHDTLAQAFTGILVQVGAATQVLADDIEATEAHLEMIDELARTGLTEARRSVSALRPQLLEEGDLSSALHRLVTQMRANTDTALIYEVQGAVYSLPAEVENNLLRIGQEALTNAIKYARASEIRIELMYENLQCILRVKDDGRGFGVGSVPRNGFGLLGMSERAERIGAQLRIESQPGQGTEIVVTVNRV